MFRSKRRSSSAVSVRGDLCRQLTVYLELRVSVPVSSTQNTTWKSLAGMGINDESVEKVFVTTKQERRKLYFDYAAC